VLPGQVVPPSDDDRAQIRATSVRQLPVELFYVFQPQLVLFCLTWFGGGTEVAGYGALGRFAQLFTPISAFLLAFGVPALSRASGKRRMAIYVVLLTLASAPGVMLIIASALAPDLVLLVLGENYEHLRREMLICAITSTATATAGAGWSLAANMGLNRFTWVQIPVGLMWVVVATQVLNLDTISGALWLQGGFALGLLAATLVEFANNPSFWRSRHG
jgi:hypothetical protein